MANDLEELSESLSTCRTLYKQMQTAKDKLYVETAMNQALIERFLMNRYPVYSPISTYFEIEWLSKHFIVNIYYVLDNTWAGSKKFPYASLEKFAKRENDRSQIYQQMREWQGGDDELEVMYDILKERFGRTE